MKESIAPVVFIERTAPNGNINHGIRVPHNILRFVLTGRQPSPEKKLFVTGKLFSKPTDTKRANNSDVFKTRQATKMM
jgi:hypothetical protein